MSKRKVKLTSAELAEAYVYPSELMPEEEKLAAQVLQTAREKAQAEMTGADDRMADILQLRFRLEDF